MLSDIWMKMAIDMCNRFKREKDDWPAQFGVQSPNFGQTQVIAISCMQCLQSLDDKPNWILPCQTMSEALGVLFPQQDHVVWSAVSTNAKNMSQLSWTFPIKA